MKGKKGKKPKKGYCAWILVLGLLFGFSQNAQAAMELSWLPPANVKIMTGIQLGDEIKDQGITPLSVHTGWIPAGEGKYSAIWGMDRVVVNSAGKVEKYRLIEIGTLDIGFGSSFGSGGTENGSKLTTHVGPGLCVIEMVCAGYVYSFIENLPPGMDANDRWRFDLTANLYDLIGRIPWPGSGP